MCAQPIVQAIRFLEPLEHNHLVHLIPKAETHLHQEDSDGSSCKRAKAKPAQPRKRNKVATSDSCVEYVRLTGLGLADVEMLDKSGASALQRPFQLREPYLVSGDSNILECSAKYMARRGDKQSDGLMGNTQGR